MDDIADEVAVDVSAAPAVKIRWTPLISQHIYNKPAQNPKRS